MRFISCTKILVQVTVFGIYGENADADLVLAEEKNLELFTVFAKGNLMIHEKKVLVKGTFE